MATSTAARHDDASLRADDRFGYLGSDDGTWAGRVRRVSLRAIIAGAIVAISLQLLFSMLGLALGAWAFEPATDNTPAEGFDIGAGIWWVVTSIISMAAGGWVAGRLAGIPNRLDGGLHGLVTWGLVTLVTFYLLSSAVGGLLNATAYAVGQSASAIGEGVSNAAARADGNEVEETANEAAANLRAATDNDPNNDPNATDSPAANDVAAAARNINTPENRQRAAEAAEAAADYVSAAALWTFLAMLLSLVAAIGGGMAGAPDPRHVVRHDHDHDHTPGTSGTSRR